MDEPDNPGLSDPPQATDPTPPESTRSTAIPPWLIVSLLTLAAAMVLGFSFMVITSSARKLRRSQASAKPPQPPAAKPLTESQRQQLEAFGREIRACLDRQDTRWLANHTDFSSFAALCIRGLKVPAGLEPQMVQTLQRTALGPGRNMFGQVATFRGITTRDGHHALAFRCDAPSGSVAYTEFLVVETGGQYRILDLHNHVLAMRDSDNARFLFALELPGNEPALSKALGGTAVDSRLHEQLRDFVRHRKSANHRGVISSFDSFPPPLQRAPILFNPFLQALQALGDPESSSRIRREVLRIPDILGRDALAFHLFSHHRLATSDLAGRIESTEAAMRIVGRDGHLLFLQGILRVMAGNIDRAEQLAAEIERLEPDWAGSRLLRAAILTGRKDFKGAMTQVQAIEKTLGESMTAKDLGDPVFDELRRSPEFKAWARTRR